jgi:hypothetical protein
MGLKVAEHQVLKILNVWGDDGVRVVLLKVTYTRIWSTC